MENGKIQKLYEYLKDLTCENQKIRRDYFWLCGFLNLKEEKTKNKIEKQITPIFNKLKKTSVLIDWKMEKQLFGYAFYIFIPKIYI